MTDSLHTKAQQVADSLGLVRVVGGRYGKQKLAVLAAYALSSLLMLAWGLSSPAPVLQNVIGARVLPQQVSTSGERWYLIHNDSDQAWTGVRLRLNEQYQLLWPQEVEAGGSLQAHTKDFLYLLYVPRAPRAGSLEEVSTQAPIGPGAAPNLAPLTLELITDQGRYVRRFDTDSLEHQRGQPKNKKGQ